MPLPSPELRCLVCEYFKRTGLTYGHVVKNLVAELQEATNIGPDWDRLRSHLHGRNQAATIRKIVESIVMRGEFGMLEHRNDNVVDEDATRENIRRFLTAFRISPLMVDSILYSEPKAGHLIKHSLFDRTTMTALTAVDEYHGVLCEYKVPFYRLPAADAVYGTMTLQPGGHSKFHAHPGDEFIYVIRGSLEVRFKNSGIHNTLNEGQYIHFWAEQPHAGYNVTKNETVAFVIRFLQLHSTASRALHAKGLAALIDRLKTMEQEHVARQKQKEPERAMRGKKQRDAEKYETIPALLRNELIWLTSTELINFDECLDNRNDGSRRNSPERVVLDRFGLGRLLKRMRRKKKKKSDDIEKDSKKAHKEAQSKNPNTESEVFLKARLANIENGVEEITERQLLDVAAAYGAAPMLLYDYLSPPERTAVVVRDDGDLIPMKPNFSGGEGIRYDVPPVRLALSDVSIFKLVLEPGKSTHENDHPGLEILLPKRGTITVKLTGTHSVQETVEKDQIVCFHSHHRHVVSVPETNTEHAEVFVLRLYQDSVQ
jgi:quercetin dioxygenase-like cupin family protein